MNPHPEYPNLLSFDLFNQERKIVHFSTTRIGGVSNGTFASFNMGNFSDDDPLNIHENRSILARMFFMKLDDFIIPHQTHGTNVLIVEKSFLALGHRAKIEKLYGVDATVTAEKGIFLCATTADCVPVLLYDRKNGIIAAIHAGWRGTVGCIVEKTILKMMDQYGASTEDMIAGIGPAISLPYYEVGDEVIGRFLKSGFDLSRVSYKKNSFSKTHLDLKEIIRLELIRLGIGEDRIEKTGFCTFEKEELFFSARRQTVHSGRMLTGIMMKE